MHHHPSNWTGGSLTEHMQSLLEAAIPDSKARVEGGGGHFVVEVVSPAFEGLGLLAKQRLVMSAIADLMKGPEAPVHAVDQIITKTP